MDGTNNNDNIIIMKIAAVATTAISFVWTAVDVHGFIILFLYIRMTTIHLSASGCVPDGLLFSLAKRNGNGKI